MTEEEQKLSEQIQKQKAERTKKALNIRKVWELIQEHRKTIIRLSDYDLSDNVEFQKHLNLIVEIGNNYLLREQRKFIIDDSNIKLIHFLLYYFNDCELAEHIFERKCSLHKNLLIVGPPGTGKTLLMQIFSDYLKMTNNHHQFWNSSVTQMSNYYKNHNHIDLYTYHEDAKRGYMPAPFSICLNDVGLDTERQKNFGTDIKSVIDEYLYARYEIYQQWGIRHHITSNFNVDDFKNRFDTRITDRFKTFNVIPLEGVSRR